MTDKTWFRRPRYTIVYESRIRRIEGGDYTVIDSTIVHSRWRSRRKAVALAKAEIAEGNTQLNLRVVRDRSGRVVWHSDWDPARIEADLREANQ